MPQPPAYTIAADFSTDEANNVGGRSTVRTAALDAELSAIAASIAAIRVNLSLNQRDDGEIRDARVRLHTLSDDVRALLTMGAATPRGLWTTGVLYALRDVVVQSGNTYICAVPHTSGTFATDLAAVRWLLIALGSGSPASSIPFTPTATLVATNVQAAIDEADTENRALSAGASAAVATLISDLAASAGSNTVGFLQSGTGATARTVQAKLRDTVSPLDFGAVGNGIANDAAALLAAMNTGRLVDLGGLSYGVTGALVPTSFGGLFNGRLVQLAPSTSNLKTLQIIGFTGFRIRGVVVDRGGSVGYTTGTITTHAGLWIENCTDFDVEMVRITNGGRGTGVLIRGCQRFSTWRLNVDEHYWQEVNPGSPVIADDVIQSHWYDNCSNFAVEACDAINVTSGAPGNHATGVAVAQRRRYTRRAFGGCTNFSVTGCRSDNIDQGFDFTGSTGNSAYTVTGCVARDTGTVGFKCANSSFSAVISNCISLRAGDRGFFVSGKTELPNPDPRDILFANCLAIDTGANLIWPTTAGFAVEAGTVATTFPRSVTFNGCLVIDRQGTPTTDFGFRTNIAAQEPPAADSSLPFTIRTINCDVHVPGITAGNAFFGMHHAAGTYVGDIAGTDTLTTSTWTALTLDAAGPFDPSALHNPASNSDRITIKHSGIYMISARTGFAANATGERALRLTVNGGNVETDARSHAHASGKTYVAGTFVRLLQAGDVLRVEGWQASGGNLGVNRADTVVSLVRVS